MLLSEMLVKQAQNSYIKKEAFTQLPLMIYEGVLDKEDPIRGVGKGAIKSYPVDIGATLGLGTGAIIGGAMGGSRGAGIGGGLGLLAGGVTGYLRFEI